MEVEILLIELRWLKYIFEASAVALPLLSLYAWRVTCFAIRIMTTHSVDAMFDGFSGDNGRSPLTNVFVKMGNDLNAMVQLLFFHRIPRG